MQILEITNQKTLDNFVASNGGDFLQSWSWGEFQASLGFKLSRLAVVDDTGHFLAVVSLVTKSLPGGYQYYFAPRGPVLKSSVSAEQLVAIWNFLLEGLNKIAQQEKIAFLRFEPPVTNNQNSYANWQALIVGKNIQPTISLEPKETAMLELSLSEQDLLKRMHHKTRYNIKLAEKKGVEVFLASAPDFQFWWNLLQTTGSRDGFRLHSKQYYQSMLQVAGMKLYLAKHQGLILAGILVSEFGTTATYVHGASSNEGRHLMAPHLLQWQAIKNAKQSSYQYYDFYGVDRLKWPGVTKFKEGFAGQNLAYLGTFDLVWLRGYYKFYSNLRKVFRFINKIKSKLLSH
jgi:lipid II:glycine glycyltransferase (peptidoglycan interpeptide bridge formation enzyme)